MEKTNASKQGVLHWLDENFEKMFLVTGLLSITLFITWQVIYRYIITQFIERAGAAVWTEELSRYIFIWISYLALSVAIKKRSSIRVDMLYDHLPPRLQQISWIVVEVLFFILTAIASVGAILSLLEVPVAVLSERVHMTRKAAAITTIAITAVLGLPAALSQGVTADLKIFGLNPFDLFDFLSSNILLPLGGILICIFVGWVYGLAAPEKRLATEGTPTQRLAIRGVFFMVRYVAPIAIAIVLLNGLKLF